jgi:alanine racemase
MRPRRAAPADVVRPTRAEINLEALRHNLRALAKYAGLSEVWPVLKADAYGHGAPAVARTLERAGARGFCVALVEEGVELREAGIRAPVLVMGGWYGDAFGELIARDLLPVVYDLGQLEGFARLVRSESVAGPVDVHLNIDTGMARLGVRPTALPSFVERLRDYPEIRVAGLMTHFACADSEDAGHMLEQLVRFDEATALLARHGIRPRVRHAANSAALLRGEARLDRVRPGVAIFGVSPRLLRRDGSLGDELGMDLRPVMTVRTEIVALRQLAPGDSVGYGALWKAQRPSSIATIPMGYADGFTRQATNRAQVLVRGMRVPVVGAVSMDMAMIDVTDLPGVDLRDEVVLLGSQDGPLGKGTISADELAAASDTIPWEVLCAVSRRVPRFYREP